MPRIPHPRFALFLGAMVLAIALLVPVAGPAKGIVLGFDVAAALFLAGTWPLWRETTADPGRARALRDDGGRGFLLVATVATLGVVALALGQVIADAATPTLAGVLVELATVALAWLFVNLVFAFHYAHLYYTPEGGTAPRGTAAEEQDRGGLGFPGAARPVFSDFAYFSFVIGMTSQTSDVTITARHLRRTVLWHGMLSYVFNFGVLALTINLIAGLF